MVAVVVADMMTVAGNEGDEFFAAVKVFVR